MADPIKIDGIPDGITACPKCGAIPKAKQKPRPTARDLTERKMSGFWDRLPDVEVILSVKCHCGESWLAYKLDQVFAERA